MKNLSGRVWRNPVFRKDRDLSVCGFSVEYDPLDLRIPGVYTFQ